jgi:hypothetical protein
MDDKAWHYGINYDHMRAGKKTKPLDSFVQVPGPWLAFLKTRPGELTMLIAMELLDLDFKDMRMSRDINIKNSEWIKAQDRSIVWRALKKLEKAGLISVTPGPIVRVLVR